MSIPVISSRTRSKAPLTTALSLSLALLAGCANRQHVTVGAVPDDYRTNHPITIAEREQVTDIPVRHGDQRLSVVQRSAVEAALANYRANGSGMIYILLPSGTPNSAAAYRLSTDIAAVLRKGGVRASNVATESYSVPSPDAAAPIRLSFYALSAGTNACGKWPDDLLNTPENKHYANFGCATQNNLAAQIANPADLLGPRATSPVSGERTMQRIAGKEGYETKPTAQTENWNETRSQVVSY